jgi:signal transduction histidine kinase
MTDLPAGRELDALSRHLHAERESILKSWRLAAEWDPLQTTVRSLTRAQFNDHIPRLLDAFESKLKALPGSTRAADADQASLKEELNHGVQRWEQGYKLAELMQEWGHLHRCISDEIGAFARVRPEIRSDTLHVAHSELIELINDGIKQSVGEYVRLQQTEAAGHVRDLRQAVENISESERRRAALIRQAVHDLRGNVQSVSTAADVLGETDIDEKDRVGFAKQIQLEVEVVSGMLGELLMLARLEAGQELRRVAPCDVAKVLAELCNANQPVAAARDLFLKSEGTRSLWVDSDAGKLRRLVQNLLLNAIKYTNEGGVTVLWGEEEDYWWVVVKDTGPGMMAGPSAPLPGWLRESKAVTEVDEIADAAFSQERALRPEESDSPPQSGNQARGEGIGLSIVKRLCELLDARVELTSSAAAGSSFRVLFPRSYQSPPNDPVRSAEAK